MVLHTDLDVVAFTAGPVVVTGRHFNRLHEIEKAAVIAHERGHIYHMHQLKRIWWLVSFQWNSIPERCHAQEFQADRYAVTAGKGEGLMRFLARFHSHKSPPNYTSLHPPVEDRLKRIRRWHGKR